MERPGVVAGNFALSFSLNFLSIFVHISGSIRPITLIWASLERSFPPAEVEYFGQKWWRQRWKKGQGSSRPVTGGTRVNGLRHKLQFFFPVWIYVSAIYVGSSCVDRVVSVDSGRQDWKLVSINLYLHSFLLKLWNYNNDFNPKFNTNISCYSNNENTESENRVPAAWNNHRG